MAKKKTKKNEKKLKQTVMLVEKLTFMFMKKEKEIKVY
jgi:hypothetical protein